MNTFVVFLIHYCSMREKDGPSSQFEDIKNLNLLLKTDSLNPIATFLFLRIHLFKIISE